MANNVRFIAGLFAQRIASASRRTGKRKTRVAAHQRTMANFDGNVMQYCYAFSPSLLIYEGNGWGGIRTPDAFRHTRFPGVHNQPLCHPSKCWINILQYRYSLRESPVVAKATRERGRTPKAARNGAAPVEHFARSALECGAFSHRFSSECQNWTRRNNSSSGN
jgi:hypothetical protein